MFGKIIFIPLLIVGALLVAFQNCAKYPYEELQTEASQTLQTKHFYHIEENFTCQTLGGETIETYKDSLYFFGGDVCFTGNGCNDTLSCGPWPVDLEVSMDLQTVTYKGEVFYFMKTPPFEN